MWILIAVSILAYQGNVTVIHADQIRSYQSENQCVQAKYLMDRGHGPVGQVMAYVCQYVEFPTKK